MGGILSVSGSPPVPHPPTIVFSSKPTILSVRKSKGKEEGEAGEEGGVERLDYRTLLQTRVPSLFTEFKPLWRLFKYVLVLVWLTESAPSNQANRVLLVHIYKRFTASSEISPRWIACRMFGASGFSPAPWFQLTSSSTK
jgi:hypothetical protein